jgi:hypothetical protein
VIRAFRDVDYDGLTVFGKEENTRNKLVFHADTVSGEFVLRETRTDGGLTSRIRS